MNADSILLAIVAAVSGWTLREVISLKVSIAEVRVRLGMSEKPPKD